MIRAIRAFLDFCYIARREFHTEESLQELENALKDFHLYREVFVEYGIRVGLSLPRQHSLKHYPDSVWAFGSPNGLCSSITESRHITAVKKPWRRSNHNDALGQMLVTNQRLDKLAAARVDFTTRGMLSSTVPGMVQHLISIFN